MGGPLPASSAPATSFGNTAIRQAPLAPLSACSGSRRSDQGSKMEQQGLMISDIDEDLAECIAAWHQSGHSGQVTPQMGLNRSQQLVPVSWQTQEQSFGPVFSVNVGGEIFRTTTATLRKSRFFNSMLKYAEEGAIGTTVDDGGLLFVDRPSELFAYILEYLRSGTWLLRNKAEDPEFVEALREEAGFYGIDESVGSGRLPAHRVTEYVTVWQFLDDTSVYVDSHEQTIREDPDHQGLFRLCKYSGGLPLDQQTCTKRFKATSHSVQAVIAYFATRGFKLQHIVEGSMITHTTSADGQSRSGQGVQYVLSRFTSFSPNWTPPNTQRGVV